MPTLDQLLATLPQPAQGQFRATLAAQHVNLTATVVDPPPPRDCLPQGDVTATMTTLGAKAASLINLIAGGAYVAGNAATNAVIAGAGTKIIGDVKTHARVALTKLPNGDVRTGIALNGPNIELAGISATGFGRLLYVSKPNVHIHDSDADSLGCFAVIGPGADGFLVEDVTGSNIGGDFFYIVASNGTLRRVKVTSMTSPNSEHCIRLDSENGIIPTNVTIDSCELTNHSTSNKETIAARAFQALRVINTIIHGWMRLGQQLTTKPAVMPPLMTATLQQMQFPDDSPNGSTLLDIKDGVDLVLDGASFGPFTNPHQSCIRVASTSRLTYRNIKALGNLSVPLINADPGAVVVQL